MADETHMTPQSLAHQILSQMQATTPQGLAKARAALADSEAAGGPNSIEALIALYFACEDADERDIVFERLVARDPEQTAPFFNAMMLEDEDEFMRIAAASLLLRRGDAKAGHILLAQLQAGGDVALFEQALAGLIGLPGMVLYPVLAAIWQDPSRESAERRAAMLGMESLDPQAASAAMVRFVASIEDLRRFADDQLEVAMAMLARQPQQAGLEALEHLAARVQAMPCADEDAKEDRDELYAFVNEGIALVRSALAPA